MLSLSADSLFMVTVASALAMTFHFMKVSPMRANGSVRREILMALVSCMVTGILRQRLLLMAACKCAITM